MARLIDNHIAVELDQVVAGLPVVEFVDDAPPEVEFVPVPRKAFGGARLDRSLEVTDWFDY